MDSLFKLSNLLVLPFWLLMILLPHWQWTRKIMGSLWVLVPPALLYAVLVLPNLLTLLPLLAQPTLDIMTALLGRPEGTLVGWVHFLAFDLFVGRWAYLDSRQRGISAWLVSPALFFVLMVGPLGLIVYLSIRTLSRSASTGQTASA